MEKVEKYRQFDRPVHLVYAYVFEDEGACYVGRTKNLRDRDNAHRRGRKHHNGETTYDNVFLFAQEKGVEIPKPIILKENLNGIESLYFEDYWVKYYKNTGWKILNGAKTGIKSGSLGHVKIWDYETCKKECENFKTRSELKENSYGCYEVCLTMGWLDDFIKVWGKHKNGYWKKRENVIDEAKKYKNISEFAHKSNGAYKSAKINGWLDDLPFGKEKNELKFEELWEYYLKCGRINDVIYAFKTSYKTVKRIFEENGKTIKRRK